MHSLPIKLLKNLDYKFSSNQYQFKLKDKSDVYYFKLSCIDNLGFTPLSKINFRNFSKSFVKKKLTFKLVYNSFKTKNYFSYKDPIPNDLKSFLVYKFSLL